MKEKRLVDENLMDLVCLPSSQDEDICVFTNWEESIVKKITFMTT
jgi:hypothetical protein